MKLSFWDILSTLLILTGLALAVIFINIFVNPYSFLNPFPPTQIATKTLTVTGTPAQTNLPGIWTSTPETPGTPSSTGLPPAATSTRFVLPTRTSTRTPNWALTYYALRTPTRTYTPSWDTIPPTNPGTPLTSSPTSDSTPTWSWAASTDGGSGMNYYQIAWGLDINCGNPVYASGSNAWTAPVTTINTTYFICVRAIDRAGNASAWAGPSGFFYAGPVGSATRTSTSTLVPTSTSTSVIPPTVTRTFTATSTVALPPTVTFTNAVTSTATATSTITPTSTNTLIPTLTYTGVPTATETLTSTFTATVTDTLVPVSTSTATMTETETATSTVAPTQTNTLAATSTMTETVTLAPTETSTVTLTPTETMTLTLIQATYTISGNTGVGPTATPAGAPVAVVAITVTGDPGAVVTQPDGLGNYSVVVPANWSGAITPARLGYAFTPVKYTYTNVSANIPGQDFTSVEAATFTISGNVGAVPGAQIVVDNGAVVTVQPELDGNYSVVVYSGWSGSIKSTHPTCSYTPPQYDYLTVAGDLTDQNFNPACP